MSELDTAMDWDELIASAKENRSLRARVAELEADLREAKGWVDAALRAAVRDVLQRCNDNGGEIDAELVVELKAALGEDNAGGAPGPSMLAADRPTRAFASGHGQPAPVLQVIPCPNCKGGWRREAGRPTDWQGCVVCETRGVLVIDGTKTLALPAQAKPK